MSDTSDAPWSNRSNAPQIPFELYVAEKEHFAGCLIGMMTYGIATILFFQCMSALLGLANTIRGRLRWALVAYTVALFSFSTMPILIDMCYLSLEYINNREFADCDEYFPGPLGYDEVLNTKPTATFYDVTFPMNQWLADGLLLHRCYVTYSLNHWAVAFSCLLYLATIVLGIIIVHGEQLVRNGGAFLTAPYRREGAESMTSELIAGTIESARSGSQGSNCNGTLSDKDPMIRMGVNGEAVGELFAGDEAAVKEVLF